MSKDPFKKKLTSKGSIYNTFIPGLCNKYRERRPLGRASSEHDILRNGRQSIAWRISVKERDKYICQHCGEKNLSSHNCIAHHNKTWEDFPELRYDINNGITLCKKCHNIHHKKL